MNYLILSRTGLEHARRLQDVMGGVIYGALKDNCPTDVQTVHNVGDALTDLFKKAEPLIAFCSSGIVIRQLAPLLVSKHDDPPVLALGEKATSVIPLLGGHHGANNLAREIGHILDIIPAITTASDMLFDIALDEPPAGWQLANPHDAKSFTAALRDGAKIKFHGSTDWLKKSTLPFSDNGELSISISDTPQSGAADHLIYHRQNLALGMGCERGTSAEEVIELITDTLTKHNISPLSLGGLFSIDLKMDETALHQAAIHFKIPVRFFSLECLRKEEDRLANPSEIVKAEIGIAGVAEAAALAAGGTDSGLLIEKHKSRRATCAVARMDHDIDPATLGQARGHLAIVGIGPGRADWRTGASATAIRKADIIIGYHLYLDLINDLIQDKDCQGYELGQEEDRVRAAIDLAATGQNVALVSSGDAGIYAMGALAHEVLDSRDAPASWGRISVELSPGISALQAAALKVGAPLGHDFCAISLSDLLTPRDVILQRVKAAAMGDFVTSFYNPVSRTRRDLLALSRDILLDHRPKDTPVILARNLGRTEEQITILPLEELKIDDVDMLTLVMVGSSETRARKRGDGTWSVYTPRGYAAKHKTLQKVSTQ